MWKVDFSQLRHIQWKDYAIRFLFGGIISVIAALIGHWINPRIGGIFTAFPAILLASLTIIRRQDGKHDAEADARGGIIGAISFVLTAIFVSVTLGVMAGTVSLLLGLVLWFVCGIALYAICFKAKLLKVNRG
ncbi:DUF3147 family protein [Dictyobacter arantiisoli]|uniref:DUF3147 domain-containing protein n=1 Tax=Dictyobacter arantiisoli TaxID=2014874 RepID=A0A5A5TG09_9CHLR|nr:DUF3147 family protein [Dictyobacter arantiisoli]GCF10297.1 hypothetical protein KDI_38610 [Dictyobacter arantiisoli]